MLNIQNHVFQLALVTLVWLVMCSKTLAHSSVPISEPDQVHPHVTYLANEAVLFKAGDKAFLFDPFFHRHFNTYALVPETMKSAIMAGDPPYHDIDGIFVSHAHGDHFSDTDTLTYLRNHRDVKLYGPTQAIEQVRFLKPEQQVLDRLVAFSLNVGDKPQTLLDDNAVIEAVRIPHAGWPGRANVENLVFRVSVIGNSTSEQGVTIMHMGDADPNESHYLSHQSHWQKRLTHLALPPYWFYLTDMGNHIVEKLLNTQQSVGVHVPVKVPEQLKASGYDYFSKSGETRMIDR